MTTSQALQVRASEIRTRLTEIAGLEGDALTDEIRGECDTLTTEYRDVEIRTRAAIVAEDEDRQAAELRLHPDAPDAETRAVRALQGRASFGRYLSGFADGEQLSGAERELAEHRGITTSGNVIPWDALLSAAPAVELRADAVTPAPATGNPTNQAAIIQRVFARSAVRRLGVAMPGVGVGIASYPVITEGPDPAFVAADGVKEATAGTLTANALLPKRLQGRILFRLEDVMTVTGLESGLSADLSASLSNQLDAQLIGAGDATVRGFLATAANGGLAAYADPAAAIDFAGAAEQAARGVDGTYAGGEDECAWIIGTATYQTLAGLIQANDSASATERLRRLLRDFMASANIPAAASNIQQGILAKLGAVDSINAVCPIWEGLKLIRDDVTNAAKGQVAVTAIAFHNFKVLRAAGFVRTKVKLA